MAFAERAVCQFGTLFPVSQLTRLSLIHERLGLSEMDFRLIQNEKCKSCVN
jgi:hypothetical protein